MTDFDSLFKPSCTYAPASEAFGECDFNDFNSYNTANAFIGYRDHEQDHDLLQLDLPYEGSKPTELVNTVKTLEPMVRALQESTTSEFKALSKQVESVLSKNTEFTERCVVTEIEKLRRELQDLKSLLMHEKAENLMHKRKQNKQEVEVESEVQQPPVKKSKGKKQSTLVAMRF